MAYENLMTGQPQNLYQQKKKERETFEAMQRQKRFASERAMALNQPQPVEQPSLLDKITKKRDEFLGPRPIDIEEYEAARNPLFTYESTPGASTYETPAGVPSVGMGGKLTPEARQNAVRNPGSHHPGVNAYEPGNVPVAAGGSGMHPGMESGYQPVYGQENPKPKEVTHTDYTKSIDKSFLAAMLQSAIPQKKPATQARAPSSGGVGRTTMPEMTPFLTGLRPKKKNPALWRYS
jgi:hypothetical protein